MPTNQPQAIPPGMDRPPGLPTSPPPPRVAFRTETVSVCVDDLRKLTALTRELAACVRELEGETPSTDDCQRYVAVTIAKVEKSI
jgi:hypothetical protein